MNEQQKEFEALIALYMRDITVFAKSVLNVHLTPKQEEICRAFQDNRTITVKASVGLGKTACLAVLIWWALCTHDELQFTIFGPSEGTLKSTIWKELQKYHDNMSEPFRSMFDVAATRISRTFNPSTCFAEYRLASAENISAARGIHSRNNFCAVDEATGVDDIVFTDALVNILSDENAKLLLISNPSSSSGFFARTWLDPDMSPKWAHVHGSYRDKYNFRQEDLELQASIYGGPTSRAYRVYIEGEFPLSDVDGLISRELIDFAVQSYSDVKPATDSPIIWGLDPAGAGKDSSALIIRQDNKILDVKQWQGLDPTQLAYKIRDLYQATPKAERPAVISVDSNGLGYGVWSNLKDWGLPAHECNSAKSPTRNPERYHRLRDQLWWEMRDWIHSENVGIINNPKLIEELATPTYQDGTGKIKVEDKKSIKKRLGRSPDFADALALTFAVSPTRFSSKYSWSKPISYADIRTFE